jgi:hypothetical protein
VSGCHLVEGTMDLRLYSPMEGLTPRYLVFTLVALCPLFNLTRPDNQVAASTAQVDHSIWTCMSNPKFEVCTISSRI